MKVYKASDFNQGDDVFHTTNSNISMVVTETHVEHNEVTCRWMDKDGKLQEKDFGAFELRKRSDFNDEIARLTDTISPKRNNYI